MKLPAIIVTLNALILMNGAACSQNSNLSKKHIETRDTLAFDIPSYPDEPWIITPRIQRIPTQPFLNEWLYDTASVFNHVPVSSVGYRVQVYSTNNYYEAVRVRDDAMMKFTVPVYLDHEVPFYKIRIGNFKEKDQADDLKNTAKALGYNDAWIVQTTIEEQK